MEGLPRRPRGRGLKAPVLCISDGHAGLRRAVGLVWPAAAVQRCCVHKLRNLEPKAPKHVLGEVRALNAGFSAPIVMALGGWKTERMMRR